MLKKLVLILFVAVLVSTYLKINTTFILAQQGGNDCDGNGPGGCYCTDSCDIEADCWTSEFDYCGWGDDDSGGWVGGGGTSYSCGTGYHQECSGSRFCPVFGTCDFPNRGTGEYCDETGSENVGNFTVYDWCEICSCVSDIPPCSATAPTGLSATDIDSGSASISWTPGANGNSQRLYLDTDSNKVVSRCSSGCLISEIPVTANPYIAEGLSPLTTYYYGIDNYQSDTCIRGNMGWFDHWPIVDSWYQVQGGNLHASSGGISSQIPATCTWACTAALITQSAAGETGLASIGSGSIDVGSGILNEDGSDWQAETVFRDNQTGYDYFARILSEDPAGIGVWDGSLPASDGVFSGTTTLTSGESGSLP